MKKACFITAIVFLLLIVNKGTAAACDHPPCAVPPDKEVFLVYVPNEFALPVEQQPLGDTGYVTEDPLKSTQFQWTDKNVIGILAHSQYSGSEFYKIKIGQLVKLYKGDGTTEIYLVRYIREFQKYGRGNSSNYRDLGSDEIYTTYEMHKIFYEDGNRLVFQTCIEENEDPLWGLRFVVAEPLISLPRLGFFNIRRW